ncbi:MAG: hypothetical protein AAF570_06960, partial [Bacteroidota bacterium]
CNADTLSNAYDNTMLQTETFDEALANGFFAPGPLNVLSEPAAVVFENHDPYFGTTAYPSQSYIIVGAGVNNRIEMVNELNGVGTLHGYTLWEQALVLTICPDTNDVATCLQSVTFGGDPCFNDQVWENFRTLYLSKKWTIQDGIRTKTAIGQKFYNGCIGGSDVQVFRDEGFICPTGDCVTPSNCGAIYDGCNDNQTYCHLGNQWAYETKTKRYYSHRSLLGIDLATATPQNMQAGGLADNATVCATKCEAMETYWEHQLRDCGLTNAQMTNLLAGLRAICEEGCVQGAQLAGEDGVNGANEGARNLPIGEFVTFHVSGSGNHNVRTFGEVWELILGTTSTEICDSLLLEMPLAFDFDYAYGSPLQLDPCACSTIQGEIAGYLARNLPQVEWADSFNLEYGTTTNATALNYFDCQCGNVMASGEHVLSRYPVPTSLQCKDCIDCAQMDAAEADFALDYNGFDPTHPNFATIYRTYMNLRFGWSLDYEDYLEMQSDCDDCVAQGTCFSDPPMLCNTAFHSVATADPANCAAIQLAIAHSDAAIAYDDYVEDIRDSIRQSYITACLGAINNETFTMDFDEQVYQHTLQYYDQSGQLVATVPPEGYEPVPEAELSEVADHRAEPQMHPRKLPQHRMRTEYSVNAYDETLTTRSPDAGKTSFWYDRLGRVVLRQSNMQLAQSPDEYSYVLYDPLGRVFESGVVASTQALHQLNLNDAVAFQNAVNAGVKREVSEYYYDTPTPNYPDPFPPGDARNLKNRVSSVHYLATPGADVQSMYFAYDFHGLVTTTYIENPAMDDMGNGLKRVDYEFDLVTGNTAEVRFQEGHADQYFWRYTYDADNRLISTSSSKDGVIWSEDARMEYYDHGPLSRVEYGAAGVQGKDYAYTIQDWIKGLNSNTMQANRDIGKDGVNGSAFARDAMAYSLGYFHGDYTAVRNDAATDRFLADETNAAFRTGFSNDVDDFNLYNSNVRQMVTTTRDVAGNQVEPQTAVFRYDHLNRLVQLNVFDQSSIVAGNIWDATATDQGGFNSHYSYDLNGNLQSLSRADF